MHQLQTYRCKLILPLNVTSKTTCLQSTPKSFYYYFSSILFHLFAVQISSDCLEHIVNFFELISCVAMVFICGVPGCTTGFLSNKSDKKLLYLDFPVMKILERDKLRLYLEKYGKFVKVTKCVQGISFQMSCYQHPLTAMTSDVATEITRHEKDFDYSQMPFLQYFLDYKNIYRPPIQSLEVGHQLQLLDKYNKILHLTSSVNSFY